MLPRWRCVGFLFFGALCVSLSSQSTVLSEELAQFLSAASKLGLEEGCIAQLRQLCFPKDLNQVGDLVSLGGEVLRHCPSSWVLPQDADNSISSQDARKQLALRLLRRLDAEAWNPNLDAFNVLAGSLAKRSFSEPTSSATESPNLLVRKMSRLWKRGAKSDDEELANLKGFIDWVELRLVNEWLWICQAAMLATNAQFSELEGRISAWVQKLKKAQEGARALTGSFSKSNATTHADYIRRLSTIADALEVLIALTGLRSSPESKTN